MDKRQYQKGQAMNERIKELAGYVEKYISTTNFEGMPEDEMTYDEIFQKKFAELIVQSILDRMETEREYYANPDTYQFLEYYTKMSAKEEALSDAISMIRSDFGVK